MSTMVSSGREMDQRIRTIRSSSQEPEWEVHSEWIDDDSVDTGSSIQAVIDEIRKEASRMDIVMALDQIHSLRHENIVAKTSLQERAVEADGLKAELEDMEERVSSLTLERDLLQVDTKNLREDLSTLVDRMFEISCVAGNSSLAESSSSSSMGDRKPSKTKTQPSSKSILRESNLSCILTDMCKSKAIEASDDDTRHFSQRSIYKNLEESIIVREATVPFIESKTLRKEGRKQKIESKKENTFRTSRCTRSPINVANSESCLLPIVEKHKLLQASTSAAEATKEQRTHDASDKPPKPTIAQQTIHKKRTEAKGNKVYSILRRNCRRLSCCSRRNGITAMRNQLDQLQSMMKLSLSTSEQLRNRLTMMSHYYEGTIHRLQGHVTNMTAEKARMEMKLATMDKENRTPLKRHDSTLRQREEEIGRRKLAMF
jgi:predicted nuclease with TOPRIM domain